MDRFEESIFPKRLNRTQYLIRIVVADACLWVLLFVLGRSSDPAAPGLALLAVCVGALIIAVYALFFVLLPRVHDAGWSGWWVLLGLFPYVGPLFHLVMLFVPPKHDDHEPRGN